MFMCIIREESKMRATAKITNVVSKNIIKIVDAPLVKTTAAVFWPCDIDGGGLQVDKLKYILNNLELLLILCFSTPNKLRY